jgi:hypothetical protein
MIFPKTGIHHQNSGVPEFLALLKWAQIENIRFAVVKSEGRLFRDHALIVERDLFRKPASTFRDHALVLEHDLLSENRYPLFGIML